MKAYNTEVPIRRPIFAARGEATSVVPDPQTQLRRIALEGYFDFPRGGVFNRVGNRLLANPQKIVFYYLIGLAAITDGRKL